MSPPPLAPILLAALLGWLLSGSPLPMALSFVLLLIALLGTPLVRNLGSWKPLPWLASLLLVGAATWLELRLFQEGAALTEKSDPPLAYHAGLALLWWASLSALFARAASQPDLVLSLASPYAELSGALLVCCVGVSQAEAHPSPWGLQIASVLPLSLSLWRHFTWKRRRALSTWVPVLPLALLLLALWLAVDTSTTQLRALWFPVEEEAEPIPTLRPPRPDEPPQNSLVLSRQIPRQADIRYRKEVQVLLHPHSEALYRQWAASTIYLRTSTLSLFEGNESLSPIPSGRWIYDQDDGESDRILHLRETAPTPPPHPDSLHSLYLLDRRKGEQLPLVLDCQALYLPSLYELADDWYQLSLQEGTQGLHYVAAAPRVAPQELRSEDLPPLSPWNEGSAYLQLPASSLPARIDLLCRDLGTGDLLESIRQLLELRCRYSLQFQTPEGSSPLVEFLFGHGQGHCEHYAAATVLILRSLGIPSRVAYGYAGGLVDEEKRLFAFRDSDFHAWAEVLTRTNEWKIFDTSPRVAEAAPRVSLPARLPAIDEGAFQNLSRFESEGIDAPSSLWLGIVESLDFFSRHFLAGTAAGLILCGGLWWFLFGRGGVSGPVAEPLGRVRSLAEPAAPLHYLRELELAARAAGMERRSGQTWREWLGQMESRGALPEAVREAVTYHYHLAYARHPRDAHREKRIGQALRAWRHEELH